MHPIEHFLYFSCAWLLPLAALASPALALHPMVFLYCIFHACVAPIAGHDGLAAPGGGADYHYLHHALFECNFGVPWPVPFDHIFGSWVANEWVELTRGKDGRASLDRAKRFGRLARELGSNEAALAAMKKE